MTLPASFPISLVDVNTELNGLLPRSMNNDSAATLAWTTNGATYSMSDFLGKSVITHMASTTAGTVGGTATTGSLAFGGSQSATNSRRIIGCICWSGDTNNDGTLSSATIGGIAATIMNQEHEADGVNENQGVAIISAFPSGSSGTVSVTFDDADARSVAVFLFRLVSEQAIDGQQLFGIKPTGAQSLGLTMTTQNRGVIIACGVTAGLGSHNIVWSGVTEVGEFEFATPGGGTARMSAGFVEALGDGSRLVQISDNISGTSAYFIASQSFTSSLSI